MTVHGAVGVGSSGQGSLRFLSKAGVCISPEDRGQGERRAGQVGVRDKLPVHFSSQDILSPTLECAHLSVWKLGASRLGLPDLANKNTGCPAQCEFQIGNK